MAATQTDMRAFSPALALHEEVTGAWERLVGPNHVQFLSSLASQAGAQARSGDLSRARYGFERVLEGRQRLLGTEHEDTLRCTEQLATLLCALGDLEAARRIQQHVVNQQERMYGMASGAYESDLGTVDVKSAIFEARGGGGDPDTLDHKLAQLQQLIDNQSPCEARAGRQPAHDGAAAERRASAATARRGHDQAGLRAGGVPRRTGGVPEGGIDVRERGADRRGGRQGGGCPINLSRCVRLDPLSARLDPLRTSRPADSCPAGDRCWAGEECLRRLDDINYGWGKIA